ncbi:hypothetical protein QBC34DRAFT_418127 [Podospora aff. communis PSN243]|uniref:Secreted protein n=1 Tax=Podospora aff. communis PSN243 TaxID=3040156 RepID=A0AAV9G1W3_9PEZI|nr:hypothetical protein QBC34DRAFT_418127 [Podospora aff. communis PSN243]
MSRYDTLLPMVILCLRLGFSFFHHPNQTHFHHSDKFSDLTRFAPCGKFLTAGLGTPRYPRGSSESDESSAEPDESSSAR